MGQQPRQPRAVHGEMCAARQGGMAGPVVLGDGSCRALPVALLILHAPCAWLCSRNTSHCLLTLQPSCLAPQTFGLQCVLRL